PWAAAGALALNRRARQRLRARLVRAARRHLSDEGEAPEVETIEPFPLVAFLLQRLGLQERVERHLRRMDVRMSPGEYVASVFTLWLSAPLLAWALNQGLLVIASVLVAAIAAPQAAFQARQAWRKKQFNDQLPDALDMISSSLRVGHGLQRALQLVGSEAEEPLGSEFRRVLA